MMNNKQAKGKIFICLKNRIANTAKACWHLNWEAKIGILLLVPPIISVIFFILNLMDAKLGFEMFPKSWNCISAAWGNGYAATPAIPLYMGLMAIAGAYLLKGNLPKKEQ